MTWLIGVAFTAVLVVFVLLFALRKKERPEYKHMLSLCVTLIGTSVGVCLALFMNSQYAEQQNRHRLSNMYDAAIEDLIWVSKFVQIQAGLLDSVDSTGYNRIMNWDSYIQVSKLRKPVLYTVIVSDPSFYSSFSPHFIAEVFGFLIKCDNYVATHDRLHTEADVRFNFTNYTREIDYQIERLKLEKSFLRGDLQADRLSDSARVLHSLIVDIGD